DRGGPGRLLARRLRQLRPGHRDRPGCRTAQVRTTFASEPTRTSGRSPNPGSIWSPDRGLRRGRGPAPPAGAAGPRRAGTAVRALRHRRGRSAGGAAGGRHPVARRRSPRQPARLADHGRLSSADRPAAQRAAASRPRASGHPALSPASQIALTLRAVGGLTTAEIARAFLVPEATMTRRITRAKVQVADSGVPFRMPNGPEHEQRLTVVLHVLYLIFTEGYAATSGPGLFRADLSAEAIRLARIVRRLLPGDGEVAGLLALMLLTDARRPARTGPAGELIPLDEQDRSRWDQAKIAEGVALLTAALPRGDVG